MVDTTTSAPCGTAVPGRVRVEVKTQMIEKKPVIGVASTFVWEQTGHFLGIRVYRIIGLEDK